MQALRNINDTNLFISHKKEEDITAVNGSEVISRPLKAPFVKFKEKQGVLIIKGSATPENAQKYYSPLITLIDEHLTRRDKISCFFFFKNMNDETKEVLKDICNSLSNHQRRGKRITINWFSDWQNNEVIDTGLDFSELYELKMNILPI